MIIYPYNTEEFIQQWELWKQYRWEQHKFKFKSPISEQAALKKLSGLAKDETEALEILLQSMANGWMGLFSLENNYETSKKTGASSDLRAAVGM